MRTRLIYVIAAMGALTCAAIAGNNEIGKWASVAGYYPGMTKESAKKAGLVECKSLLGTVECKAPGSVRISDITSTSSRVALDEKTGRLEKVEFQFPDASYQTIVAAMVKQLGRPTAKNYEYEADDWRRRGYASSCMSVTLWHRRGDDLVVVCGESGRRGGVTHVVAERVRGRGKEWGEAAAERAKSRQTTESFNSK